MNPGQTRKQPKGDKPATSQAEKAEPGATQAADKAKGFVWNPNPTTHHRAIHTPYGRIHLPSS
ncbi:hypothetical protein Q9L42_013465 [Methylomarinum sp. Ch1-1]|uniref:Uncharacterized protein n=1 Tax=Methylomarinum roseum TaxID=3067653 RepID=A0AAU7NQW1_9GAMM|nr:hypothetical protein [Methylomarinum sp. Ch1-1]MDP4520671.1 hypothetical protein [Methylomarinum sp. Ch1-1]MDP4523093.1 hypothetical protein [Methylomarinum sp. Ch1-1]